MQKQVFANLKELVKLNVTIEGSSIAYVVIGSVCRNMGFLFLIFLEKEGHHGTT